MPTLRVRRYGNKHGGGVQWRRFLRKGETVLSSAEKRELATRGHHLKANVNVAGGELSEATVEHVRKAFGKKELLKVRISTDDRDECAATARQLAEKLPCELVQVMGRVALLYKAGEGEEGGDEGE